MPELPEVETTARGLRSCILGKQVQEIETRRENLRLPIPTDLQDKLAGASVISVARRAKYLIMGFDNRLALLWHLGMSGSLRTQSWLDYTPRKHDHIIMTLENTALIYHDPRRFGLVNWIDWEAPDAHPLLSHFGTEPLTEDFNGAYLYNRLRTSKAAIKAQIMKQELVVGVGNIYATEALYAAGIHPARPAYSLTQSEAALLCQQIKLVLLAAIESGGSTLRDYTNSEGKTGYFQHRFLVYGKENAPCSACQQPIERSILAGRSSFFVLGASTNLLLLLFYIASYLSTA